MFGRRKRETVDHVLHLHLGGATEPNEGVAASSRGSSSSLREHIKLKKRTRDEQEEADENCLSILAALFRKMIFCCCWPIQKCCKVLALLDTVIVGYFAYKSTNNLMETWGNWHWTTIAPFLFFVAFFVCHVLGTVLLILGVKRNMAHYCLPRLVLISGLTVCSLICILVMIAYFTGASVSINAFIFRVYEYFFEQQLSDVEKVEMKHELIYYGIAFLILAIAFFVYNVLELMLTRKLQKSLNVFTAVPTAPPAPYNPAYAAPPQKAYPNLA
ncbi:unnamed protein product [Caenorhabditis bovis]|uniref:Uncharacterized protein n=1 Tax=Caenorhabditis bovis TaxID=2654633 RepID=A0A8S1F002_9PELO|nr:unnamed protein product [Caenorhabditis bovis]